MRDRAGILHLFVVVSEGFNCSIVPYAFYLACEAGRVSKLRLELESIFSL
jgi:hypothetical protein